MFSRVPRKFAVQTIHRAMTSIVKESSGSRDACLPFCLPAALHEMKPHQKWAFQRGRNVAVTCRLCFSLHLFDSAATGGRERGRVANPAVISSTMGRRV